MLPTMVISTSGLWSRSFGCCAQAAASSATFTPTTAAQQQGVALSGWQDFPTCLLTPHATAAATRLVACFTNPTCAKDGPAYSAPPPCLHLLLLSNSSSTDTPA